MDPAALMGKLKEWRAGTSRASGGISLPGPSWPPVAAVPSLCPESHGHPLLPGCEAPSASSSSEASGGPEGPSMNRLMASQNPCTPGKRPSPIPTRQDLWVPGIRTWTIWGVFSAPHADLGTRVSCEPSDPACVSTVWLPCLLASVASPLLTLGTSSTPGDTFGEN